MSPVSKNRKQPRRTRRTAPPRSATTIALNAFSTLLDDGSPLGAELLLAELLGVAWEASEWARTEAAESLGDEILDGVRAGHPAGGLVLATIARTGPPVLRAKAEELLDAGLASGSTSWRLPEWADLIGTAQLRRTSVAIDVFGDQTSYYLEFAYPDTDAPETHVLVILVDYNLHLIKDMFVLVGADVMESLEAVTEEDDGLKIAPMDLQSAADDLWRHLEITDNTIGEPFGEESVDTRYLVESRLDRLPPPGPRQDRPEVADADRERVVDAFLATNAVKDLVSGVATLDDDPPSRETVAYIARMAVDYACDYGVGDPLRWSPIAVELFLTDWAPRKVVWSPEDVVWVPEVLDLLVSYAGHQRGLEKRWVEETLDAVEEYGPDFLVSELDGTAKGPAAQIVESMLADGIDVIDDVAVQAWLERYNDSL